MASAVQDRDDTYYSCIVMICDPSYKGGNPTRVRNFPGKMVDLAEVLISI